MAQAGGNYLCPALAQTATDLEIGLRGWANGGSKDDLLKLAPCQPVFDDFMRFANETGS